MNCICDPCRNKIEPSCGGTFEIKQNDCVYPDSYMVDFNPGISPTCNTLCEHLCYGTGSAGGIRYCDRNLRLQGQMSGSFIVQRIPIGGIIGITGQTNLVDANLYQFYQYSRRSNLECPTSGPLSANQETSTSIVFNIGGGPYGMYSPIPDTCLGSTGQAGAWMVFPSYRMTCDATKSTAPGDMIPYGQYYYVSYTTPATCNSAFTLKFYGPYDPCVQIPLGLTFTPVI